MRILPFIIATVITLALIFLGDNKWGSIPPLGKFLSPQQGFWQNAEAADHNFTEKLTFPNLQGKVKVYLDDRLVPHIFAEQDRDAYFVQGYLHAKFRLWQMEFQTMAAAGRISEILGNDPRYIRYDREQRRLGMTYGAENAVKAMEADPTSKSAVDAYTAGINAYINSLTAAQLPIEYKLLDYSPEQWNNLKIGLFLKQMSKDLAGFERDLEFTNLKAVMSTNDLEALYPQLSEASEPIIPKGTVFAPPAIVPVKPATADSLYFNWDTTINAVEINKPNPLNGSNNWALSGQKTASGAPMLANDPHLGLSLPSIWYEMQISTPTMNAYGVTFPGSPSVIIGFNDSIAFGFTNAGRDVKDYYAIRFKDATKREYWFDSAWQPTTLRIEQIKVKGAPAVQDTVAYTVFGPVMYDRSFTTGDTTSTNALAVRWTAHDVSNEGLMWLKLNRAKNYNDYLEAIKVFQTPGQNMLFASKSGDIALWQQAKYPAQWKGQGLYVMPGEDSSYMWQGYIPQAENPHVVNPPSGFIQSANQRPVDSAYPYFMPGGFAVTRGVTIHNQLLNMQGATPEQMMQLQNNNYDGFAAAALPLLLKYVDRNGISNKQQQYLDVLGQWDYNASAETAAPTIFRAWWDSLEKNIWSDELARVNKKVAMPDDQTLLEWLQSDSAMKFVDNITTPEKETIQQVVTHAFQKVGAAFQNISGSELLWWKRKNTTVYHLLKTALMPFASAGLQTGGTKTAINALSHDHGPSWRMIVHLTEPTEAYGVYPGGQSGNPGSRFYDSYVQTWVKGQYNTLWMMKETEKSDKRIRWTLTFSNI